MSASSWSVCPRCLWLAKKGERERVQAAADAYGKVPAQEYENLRRNAAAFHVNEADYPTHLREDYEIWGAESGTVTVVYNAHCEKCDLVAGFSDEQLLWAASREKP